MENFFLGCDWGTSSFRLRLFDSFQNRVIGEIVSEDGIGNLHRSWQSRNVENDMTRDRVLRNYLREQTVLLSGKLSLSLDDITIVISGMASSSIGLEDIPYAKVPFPLDGSGALIKKFYPEPDFPHQIILLSGVCTESDVMRGEETQLLGLLALLEQYSNTPEEAMLIFPGTHSKHVYIRKGQLVDFKTFMTGELYHIMGHFSILKDSIDNNGAPPSGIEAEAFKSGLQQSVRSGILNGLFTVRTNQLFNRWEKKQNALYLSGILIGEEMNYLAKTDALPLILCSGQNLHRFYKMALDELDLASRTTIVPFDLADHAALAGQNLIYQKHRVNS